MRYIDIAQWINDNAYAENCDDDTLVKYLFILIFMLASKGRFFRSSELYDSFAMYSATRVYERLRNKKQDVIDNSTGEVRMRKIENILSYIQTVIGYHKVDFQNEEFYQGYITRADVEIRGNYEDDYVPDVTRLYTKMEDALTDMTKVDAVHTLSSIPKMIRRYLITPYKDDRNIYTSCLLTFINYFRQMIENHERYNLTLARTYTPAYYKDIDFADVVTLYHLDADMKDYVIVQCRAIKNKLVKELSIALASELPSSDVIRNVMYSGLAQLQGVDMDEYS